MGLSEKDKKTILALHNNERSSVNPGAPALKWDPQLAAAAQEWVDGPGGTPEGGHDEDRGECGENMAWGWGSGFSVANGVESWLEEKDLYNGEVLDGMNYWNFGHYTQMIWKMSDRIGCGYVKTDDGYALCCRYTVSGNMQGYRPYDTYDV